MASTSCMVNSCWILVFFLRISNEIGKTRMFHCWVDQFHWGYSVWNGGDSPIQIWLNTGLNANYTLKNPEYIVRNPNRAKHPDIAVQQL